MYAVKSGTATPKDNIVKFNIEQTLIFPNNCDFNGSAAHTSSNQMPPDILLTVQYNRGCFHQSFPLVRVALSVTVFACLRAVGDNVDLSMPSRSPKHTHISDIPLLNSLGTYSAQP